MRAFLLVTGGLLGLAVVVALGVFYLLQTQPVTVAVPGEPPRTATSSLPGTSTPSPAAEPRATTVAPVIASDTASDTTVATPVPASGIPLRDLPLTPAQQETVATLGINVETFVITPAMQDCAADALGAERLTEIIAGAAPGTFETLRILPCLSAE